MCVCVCVCVCVCLCAFVHACVRVCKVRCSNSVNEVTPEKVTSELYNFASTLAIEMYLGKHMYLCK